MREVEDYYDANTASFTRTGQGGAAIHRAIWAAGVKTRAEAFRVIDGRVLEALRATPAPRKVVDLGCGVGSSLWWLKEREDFEGVGVTLSAVQVEAANRLFGAHSRLKCLKASYTDLPAELTHIALAFAIESFAHAPSVEAFVAPIAQRLRSGGRLLVCDDFSGPRAGEHSRLVEDFRWGWVAASLVPPQTLIEVAAAHGLDCVGNEDFTGQLELGRPRDRVLEVIVALGRPFKPKGWMFRSWVGGTALQRGLRNGAIEHRLLSFVKR